MHAEVQTGNRLIELEKPTSDSSGPMAIHLYVDDVNTRP